MSFMPSSAAVQRHKLDKGHVGANTWLTSDLCIIKRDISNITHELTCRGQCGWTGRGLSLSLSFWMRIDSSSVAWDFSSSSSYLRLEMSCFISFSSPADQTSGHNPSGTCAAKMYNALFKIFIYSMYFAFNYEVKYVLVRLNCT